MVLLFHSVTLSFHLKVCATGLPMHTDETPFVLSSFWTPPPLLQMTGNSKSSKSMILDFTSLSHWSTYMLEVAQQLIPVSGISCGPL